MPAIPESEPIPAIPESVGIGRNSVQFHSKGEGEGEGVNNR